MTVENDLKACRMIVLNFFQFQENPSKSFKIQHFEQFLESCILKLKMAKFAQILFKKCFFHIKMFSEVPETYLDTFGSVRNEFKAHIHDSEPKIETLAHSGFSLPTCHGQK